MSYKSVYDRPIPYDTWEYTYYFHLRNLIGIFTKHFPEDEEYFKSIHFKTYFFKYIYKMSSKKISDTDKDNEYINFLIEKNG